jgi:hypothetical protein
MRQKTIDYWLERGYAFEPSLLQAPGELLSIANDPYYAGEENEVGYAGQGRPLIVSRYLMGTHLGRPLERSELVRFRGDNKKDFRLSNLVLHSKLCSAQELYRVNGDPIPGYSHCLCGCGTALDLVQQRITPHAYVEGHRPKTSKGAKAQRHTTKQVRAQTRKAAIKGNPRQPESHQPEPHKAEPEDGSRDPTSAIRDLVGQMLNRLSWDEFQSVMQLVLEIYLRKGP